MAAFFEDYKNFYGKVDCDESGKSLDEFLRDYDISKYQTPANTVDTLVFARKENDLNKGLKLLLIKRRNHPSIGMYALPGGFVEMKENLMDAALRELEEETGVNNIEVEQLSTYGDYKRDPRTRIITTAYVALVNEADVSAKAGDDAAYAGWFSISEELISSEEYKENGHTRVCELHKVTLSEDNKDTISAEVYVKYNKDTILRNRVFEVANSSDIAADHAAIILDGYYRVLGK